MYFIEKIGDFIGIRELEKQQCTEKISECFPQSSRATYMVKWKMFSSGLWSTIGDKMLKLSIKITKPTTVRIMNIYKNIDYKLHSVPFEEKQNEDGETLKFLLNETECEFRHFKLRVHSRDPSCSVNV
jgi:hypothetical protein